MKRSVYQKLLVLEAGLLMAFFLLKMSLPELFGSLMAFPFEQMGRLFQALSLSGSAGNLLAWLLYVLLCLSPLILYLWKSRKKKVEKEDHLLLLLTGVLFLVLYYMINPGKMGMVFGSEAGRVVGRAFLGGSIYSVLIAYGALKALRIFLHAEKVEVQKYLVYLLGFLNILFVLHVFGLSFGGYLEARQSFRAGNTDPSQNLFLSELFLLLVHLVRALPYFLSIFLVNHLMELFDEMRKDRFSEETVKKAHGLTRLSVKVMVAIVLSGTGIHVLQLIFMKGILSISGALVIPVMPMIFVLGVLLMTQLISENRMLKEDNDLFI